MGLSQSVFDIFDATDTNGFTSSKVSFDFDGSGEEIRDGENHLKGMHMVSFFIR